MTYYPRLKDLREDNDCTQINVSTENGNALIISEEDYNALLETLYLSSNPIIRQEILDGKKTPLDECIPEDEVQW